MVWIFHRGISLRGGQRQQYPPLNQTIFFSLFLVSTLLASDLPSQLTDLHCPNHPLSFIVRPLTWKKALMRSIHPNLLSCSGVVVLLWSLMKQNKPPFLFLLQCLLRCCHQSSSTLLLQICDKSASLFSPSQSSPSRSVKSFIFASTPSVQAIFLKIAVYNRGWHFERFYSSCWPLSWFLTAYSYSLFGVPDLCM